MTDRVREWLERPRFTPFPESVSISDKLRMSDEMKALYAARKQAR